MAFLFITRPIVHRRTDKVRVVEQEERGNDYQNHHRLSIACGLVFSLEAVKAAKHEPSISRGLCMTSLSQ